MRYDRTQAVRGLSNPLADTRAIQLEEDPRTRNFRIFPLEIYRRGLQCRAADRCEEEKNAFLTFP